MCAIHLCVVKLEGNSQCTFPQTPFVFSPNQKRIVEHTAIHANRSIYLILCKGRRADNHAICQVMIPAAFSNLFRQSQVIGIELLQIIGERDIAGTDFTLPIGYNGADGKVVVLHQLPPYGKHIELFDVACRLSDTPAH